MFPVTPTREQSGDCQEGESDQNLSLFSPQSSDQSTACRRNCSCDFFLNRVWRRRRRTLSSTLTAFFRNQSSSSSTQYVSNGSWQISHDCRRKINKSAHDQSLLLVPCLLKKKKKLWPEGCLGIWFVPAGHRTLTPWTMFQWSTLVIYFSTIHRYLYFILYCSAFILVTLQIQIIDN